MRQSNKVILIAILSFLLANQYILYFEIVNSPQPKTITFQQNNWDSQIDTLKTNDYFKLGIQKEQTESIIDLELFFNKNPSLLLYIFFLTFFMSISVGLIFPLMRSVKEQLKYLNAREKAIYSMMSVLVTFGIFMVCNVIPHAFSPQELIDELGIFLKHPVAVMMILLAPLLIVTAMCIFGMLCVSKMIEGIKYNQEIPESAIELFLRCKKLLDEYVMIFGLLIASGSIIISSTLASSINSYFQNNANVHFVPKEFIYLYGLAFTAILIIIYVPIYLKLRSKGENLLSELNPLNTRNMESWTKANGTYMELLGINGKIWDNVGASLQVFLPFITSIITTIVS